MHSGINGQRCLVKMSNVECSIEEKQNYIKSLKNEATSDLSVGPLKQLYREIYPVIHDLISCSFSLGIFPKPLFKCTKIIHLHKNGQKFDTL